MADDENNTTLAAALHKLATVELTFEELAAVSAAVLDDDVHGFGPSGVIDWGQVGRALEVPVTSLQFSSAMNLTADPSPPSRAQTP